MYLCYKTICLSVSTAMNYAKVSKYFCLNHFRVLTFQIVIALKTAEAERRKTILAIISTAVQSVFYTLIREIVF